MKFSEIHLFLYPWKKILFRENYQNFAVLYPWKRKSIREKIQKCVRENFRLPVKMFEKVCVTATFPSVKKIKKRPKIAFKGTFDFQGKKNADVGGGGQKSTFFADVISGWPLRSYPLHTAQLFKCIIHYPHHVIQYTI